MKKSASVTPTFLLKGVDPIKIFENYRNGYFNREITNKSKIAIAKNTVKLAPKYDNASDAPIYCIKDKNNCDIIVATTGHNDYEVFTKTGGNLKKGGRCEHCREDFTETSVGYPVAYCEKEYLINTTDSKNNQYRLYYTFWVEGTFCSFECALGYLRLILSKPADYRTTNIRDSEYLLHFLYILSYKTSDVLRPAQDPRLLKVNGGSLTKEEWNDNKHVYVRTDRVITIPAKIEYIQQNYITPVSTIDIVRDMRSPISSS